MIRRDRREECNLEASKLPRARHFSLKFPPLSLDGGRGNKIKLLRLEILTFCAANPIPFPVETFPPRCYVYRALCPHLRSKQNISHPE